jgi:hypothetical protein
MGHKNPADDYTGVAVEFQKTPIRLAEFENFTNFFGQRQPTVGQAFKYIKSIRLYLDFVPRSDWVTGNRVTIKINGIEKDFKIPEQGKEPNYWPPTGKGIYLFATNEP